MNKKEKQLIIEDIKEKFSRRPTFYIADASCLTVPQITKFRRMCIERGVDFRVVKNTLIRKAMEASKDSSLSANSQKANKFEPFYEVLKGPTSLLFADVSNLPAKIIKDFRKQADRPILKAALIDAEVYIGDEHLSMLASLKSKEELLGEIIGLLQSPIKNVAAALASAKHTIAGIVKALSEK